MVFDKKWTFFHRLFIIMQNGPVREKVFGEVLERK